MSIVLIGRCVEAPKVPLVAYTRLRMDGLGLPSNTSEISTGISGPLQLEKQHHPLNSRSMDVIK